MADATSYPDAGELQALLVSAGVFDESWSLDLQGALDAAVEQFELDTDCRPFLAAGVDTTRYFSLERAASRLFLGCGILSVAALTVDGTTYTQGVSFYLRPANAPAEGAPYTYVQFQNALWTGPDGIVITGRWGYCTELPQLARNAILAYAAASLAGVAATRRRVTAEETTGVEKSRKAGPVEIEFATHDPSKTADLAGLCLQWGRTYGAAVRRFTVIS